jgi:nitronate monooxygenase
MNESRRAFSIAGLLASTCLLGRRQAHAAEAPAPATRALERSALLDRLGITMPVLQAAMGAATPELAAAVSNAGGLGAMGLSWSSPDEVRASVARTRDLTRAPFAVGYVLSFGAATLQVALDAGAAVVQMSFGMPNPEQVAAVRAAGARLGIQISTVEAARRALDLGVDYLNLQGQEAGGHVQAQGSWRDELAQVCELAATTPVNVAGGLAHGQDLREVLNLGAAGGVFGTRFVATHEYPAHPAYKQRLLAAQRKDSVLTVCFDGGWSNVLHRVLRNPTLDAWEAAGAQPAGMRPGEGELVGHLGAQGFARYGIFPPLAGMVGAVENMAMYAGIGAEHIHDIPGAGELVRRLWQECSGAQA